MKIFSFLRNNDDGASAVEFAIVLPLFLILIFGIIEFGIIMYNKAMITNASREGARFGILYNPVPGDLTGDIQDKVADKLGTDMENLGKSRLISLGNPSEAFNPEVRFFTSGTDNEKYLEVEVEYRYQFLIMHLLWTLIPGLSEGAGGIDLNGTTTMRMEDQGT